MTEDTSKGNLQLQTFSFKWKIDRFFADCQQIGSYYKSPQWPIEYPNKTTKWYFKVYPQGDKEENKDYISLILHYVSESYNELKINCRFSIVGKQGNVIATKSGTASPKGYEQRNGWFKFAYSSAIKSDVLSDDSLTILFEFTFDWTDQNVPESVHGYCDEWLDTMDNRLGDYEKLLESGDFSDVTFKVQDKQINLHKNILSCRNPVFKAMFEHDMIENKQNSADITDIDYDVMKELFRFLYSDKVRNLGEIAGELLIAADKYQVIDLKTLCEKTLYRKLTVDNALEYLKLTDTCDTVQLRTSIIKFIGAHFKEVIKKPGFEDLSNKVMYQIMLAAPEKDPKSNNLFN